MSIVLNKKLKLALLIGLIEFIQIVQCGGNFSANTNNSVDSLIFAHSICRHGNRNIVESYPTDPWKDEQKYWIDGFGQLTNLGKQEQYDLGKYMRSRYAKLLGNGQYSPRKVYIKSTDSDRSLMSAQAAVAGLFPPLGDEIWNENILWNPIPIHTIPQKQDYVLSVLKPCARFDYEMALYTKTTAYTDLFEENSTLLRHLEGNSGEKLKTLIDILKLCDTLIVEKSKGYRLPAWAERIVNDEFYEYVQRGYSIWTGTDAMKKFRSGFLLKDMLDRFSRKMKSTRAVDRSLRMYLYFAHDITIADMLNSLGIHMLQPPPVSACLHFELFLQSDSNPYVQLFYKNSKEVNVPPLEIPKCGIKCPLKKLYELYDHILPKKSHAEECALRDGEVMPLGGNPLSYTLN